MKKLSRDYGRVLGGKLQHAKEKPEDKPLWEKEGGGHVVIEKIKVDAAKVVILTPRTTEKGSISSLPCVSFLAQKPT